MKTPKHLKEKEKEIVKMIEKAKTANDLKKVLLESFRCGLSKIEFWKKCPYCRQFVRDLEKHKCKDIKAMEILMRAIVGLTRREAELIWFAGDDVEEGEDPANLQFEKLEQIIRERKLKWRKEEK